MISMYRWLGMLAGLCLLTLMAVLSPAAAWAQTTTEESVTENAAVEGAAEVVDPYQQLQETAEKQEG